MKLGKVKKGRMKMGKVKKGKMKMGEGEGEGLKSEGGVENEECEGGR